MMTGRDMERLEKKRIHGHTDDSSSPWGWVGGRWRRLWQTSLGQLDAIRHAVEGPGPTPQHAEVLPGGRRATLAKACRLAQSIDTVEAHCPKRQQGVSVGTSIALAALHRAIEPLRTRAVCAW